MLNTLEIFANLILPIIAGLIFLGLARYVRYIAPMRLLVAGKLTYRGAFWGFIFFGIYLATRPLQILLGPHPLPLIINNIREFFMIGLFGPAVFLAMLNFVYGEGKLKKPLIIFVCGLGLILATLFVVFNIFAIGGSKEIFRVGSYAVYDGLWFDNPDLPTRALMRTLFVIRLLDPVILLLIAGIIVFWRGVTYPRDSIYTNMPRKYFFMAGAVFAFAFSMLFAGFMFLIWKIPNQWWIYYVGALLAGFLEAISLSLPLSQGVKITDHQ